MINYFISYAYPEGQGNFAMSCDCVITGIEDIRAIQAVICEKFDIENAIIINFIKLPSDN